MTIRFSGFTVYNPNEGGQLMKIKEYHPVIVDKHPYAETLNKKIMEEADRVDFYTPIDNQRYTNIRGSQYNFPIGEETEGVKTVMKWVDSLCYGNHFMHKTALREHNLIKVDMTVWFAKYGKDQYTIIHDHRSDLLAFVYFVNAPKGASPLVFTTSGKKIKAEAGKIVVFPGTIQHCVPKNKCENRLVLAGNIIFKEK